MSLTVFSWDKPSSLPKDSDACLVGAELEAGLELGDFQLVQPVTRRNYSGEPQPGPSSLCLQRQSVTALPAC